MIFQQDHNIFLTKMVLELVNFANNVLAQRILKILLIFIALINILFIILRASNDILKRDKKLQDIHARG